MKKTITNFLGFIKEYYFIIFAIISLAIPDAIVRNVIDCPDFCGIGYSFYLPCAFSALWIVVLLTVFVFALKKTVGKICYLVFSLLSLLLSVSQFVYYKIFSQIYWLSSIFLAKEAEDYFSFASQYISKFLWCAIIVDIIFIALTIVFWKKPKKDKKLTICGITIPLIILLIINILMQPWGLQLWKWDSWNNPRMVYAKYVDSTRCTMMSGLYQYSYKNLETTFISKDNFSKEEYKEATEFFANKKIEDDNEMTGVFKDKNVVMIMLESIDDWLLTEDIMPNLCKLQQEGIDFTNNYAPTFGCGFTFNTEFTSLVGFTTPKSVTTSTNFIKNDFRYALPNMFNNAGYISKTFHYNKPNFYNRRAMHTLFGAEEYVSFLDYVPEEVAVMDSNITDIDEVYKKMTENNKFFDFLITYSAHLPYDNNEHIKIKEAKKLYPDLVKNPQTEMDNAKLLAHDTDVFIGKLVDKLEADGLLDNTVLVFYADHWTYGYSNQDELKAMLPKDKVDFELHKVPFIIYSKGQKPIKVDKITKTLDIYPTLMNLFGLEKHPYYAGDDAFDPDNSGYVYFEHGQWYDGNIYYSDKLDKNGRSDLDYIEQKTNEIEKIKRITDIMIYGDYFHHIKE